MGEKFRYQEFVGIGETNMEGNVYWARYFDWFGKAREVFLLSLVPNFVELFSSGLRIVTHETSIKHISSAFFTEEIILELSIGEIKNASAKIMVDFIKKASGEKIAEGWQTIVFADAQGKIMPIPSNIKEAGLKYLNVSSKIR